MSWVLYSISPEDAPRSWFWDEMSFVYWENYSMETTMDVYTFAFCFLARNSCERWAWEIPSWYDLAALCSQVPWTMGTQRSPEIYAEISWVEDISLAPWRWTHYSISSEYYSRVPDTCGCLTPLISPQRTFFFSYFYLMMEVDLYPVYTSLFSKKNGTYYFCSISRETYSGSFSMTSSSLIATYGALIASFYLVLVHLFLSHLENRFHTFPRVIVSFYMHLIQPCHMIFLSHSVLLKNWSN